MAVLTIPQAATLLTEFGMPRGRVVEFVSIGIAESGLRTDAVSSAGAIGVWQQMPFNATDRGYQPDALYRPTINALITVQLSGQGVNCAAWDTAYADIGATGRYPFLAWPEAGSAAWRNEGMVAAVLSHGFPAPVSGGPPPGAGPTGAQLQAQQWAAELQSIELQLVEGTRRWLTEQDRLDEELARLITPLRPTARHGGR